MTRPESTMRDHDEAIVRAENRELRGRLAELEETLQAIRTGDVDALVVGEQIYVLTTSGAAADQLRRSALASVADAVIVLDAEFRVVWLNAAAERSYGVPSGDALGRRFEDVYTQEWLRPEDVPRANEALDRGEEWRSQGTHLTSAGATLFVEATLSTLQEGDGGRRETLVILRDVTGQHDAVEKLKESERRLTRAQQAARVGVWDWNLRTGAASWSTEAWRIFGQRPGAFAVTYERWLACVHPADRREAVAAIDAARANGFYRHEYRLLPSDGQTRWIESRGELERDHAGEPVRMLGTVLDITERKRAEEVLRVSEAQFRTMADGAPVIIWVTNASGEVEFVNHEYCRYFGVTLDQVLGPHWQPLVHPDDHAYVDAYVDAVRTQGAFRAEARVRRGDGEWRWISSSGTPRLSATGDFAGHVGCSFDITEQKQLRAFEAEAARQKDQFIAILAHELRNPLAPIFTSLALLRAKGRSDPLLVRCRDVIDRQAALMARLLDDLLDVSRLSRDALTLQRAPLSLRDAVDAAMELSRPAVEQQQHTLNLHWNADSIVLEADSARLTQVIGNLLINAAKYTRTGGTIDLSVRREDGDVVIKVGDNGIGIDAETLETIFHLFARGDHAPPQGAEGLGIGLALARRLVEMHGGTLQAASPGRGHGSDFVVRLPRNLVIDERVTAEPPLAPDHSWRDRRVLVVDDNVDSAEMLGCFFNQYGAIVRTIHDGESAWRAAAEFDPHVVLLD